MGVLPLLLFLSACTDPVINLEEPAEVETCDWLIPVGIELVNDYVYTLLETDLGVTGGDPAGLPTSLIALNLRGQELDVRADQLECDLDVLNQAIVEATAGIDSDDPVVQTFLETVRGGVVSVTPVYGEWRFVDGVMAGVPVTFVPAFPILLTIDVDAIRSEAGCNVYGYPVNLDGGRLEWVDGPVTITDALCLNDDGTRNTALIDTEEAYVQALLTIDGYSVEGFSLTLTGPEVELRFISETQPDSAGD